MKNSQIKNLKEVVPKEIRIQVYKDALRYYASLEEGRREIWGTGLCMVIPCALWDFSHYLDNESINMKWDFDDTGIAFPELNSKVLYHLQMQRFSCSLNEARCALLKTWISILEKS